jgi:hypothetical protein
MVTKDKIPNEEKDIGLLALVQNRTSTAFCCIHCRVGIDKR